ncbi:glycosyltransferase family 1 protein [Actinobacteria bacterium YIM 96077]|uniref:Alpha-(1-2)-phosphatidylinositol mannosyltransferase n=1 Tax=Phytoactinopolyspora halophila TaxID=1981511 RepID=A0A329QYI9_9ACTN|nr:glycosyltransferase family 4 protein [Phytoactinopolyspora halophila]AYY13325.1 glycosyltransferase family 1 protein [Actinobacteria bacterium YIM 96077]RAW17440.1 alpha-(1-2)-phosphatidylinositol mannosyltransferase [Phytoactinopolyspora halophila]
MNIGIVCPYSWGVPGGVQFHVRDFSEELMARGHTVSVLAPGGEEDEAPSYVVKAGRPVPVPYNGSVARILFGPRAAARVRRWLSEGKFDVVHIHEPTTLSLGLLATWWTDAPVVATFHQATSRSRAMSAAHGILQSAFEKVSARIAVSEEARRTLVEHLGGDAVLIPNGIYVDRFDVPPRPEWQGEDSTLCFLGRVDEPRKGLPVLLEAWPEIHTRVPGARLLVAGPGDVDEARRAIPAEHRDAVTFLGSVSDDDKAAMLASSDLYVAPHIGGESFGIVLVEAMAAGTPVLASGLTAFRAVLDDGRLGALVPVGDASALAEEAYGLLSDSERRERYRQAASVAVRRYDWSVLTDEVLAVYEMVMAVGSPASSGRRFRMPGREGRHS